MEKFCLVKKLFVFLVVGGTIVGNVSVQLSDFNESN